MTSSQRRSWALAPLASVLLLGLACLSPPGASAAKAGNQGVLSAADLELITEFIQLLRPDLAAQVVEADAAGRASIVQAELGRFLQDPARAKLLPTWLAYAKDNFDEGGAAKWVTERTAVLIALGPPSAIHSEDREWEGQAAQLIGSPWGLMKSLAGAEMEGEEEFELEDEFPTEAWVYAFQTKNEETGELEDKLRVVWFADVDGEGRFLRVFMEVLDAGARVSDAPRRELPGAMFGDVAASSGKIKDLPELKDDAIPVVLDMAFSKAEKSQTLVRFALFLDPADIELELDIDDPVDYLSKAQLWLRIERDGQALRQDFYEATPEGLAGLPDLFLDELVGVPLAPGNYGYTVVVTDGRGRGGKLSGKVEVPSMTTPLAMSSVILTKATGYGDDATIPKADLGATDSFQAFRVGSYIVRPHVAATFKRGESLGMVTQIYNAKSAVLEYDLFFNGRPANALDPVKFKALPATDIQLIPIPEQWPDGKYKFVVTASDPKSSSPKIVREVTFRVKGQL